MDYTVTNHGNRCLLIPNTQRARKNLTRNVEKGRQWFGHGLIVELRYIRSLVDQLREEGWKVQ